MGKSSMWSPGEVEQILRENPLDKDRVQLLCGRHKYVGSGTPPQPRGCKECWQAYWWYMIASTPPHLRLERLEAAERMIREANILAAQGKFDFEPYAHAVFDVEKDVNVTKTKG